MEEFAETTLTRLIDKVDYKYYGKYRGIVVDNNDPEKLGRLKVKVPSMLGNDVVTGWAMPCLPYGGALDQGFFFIPEVDAGVWVEFEGGDLEFPIWVGTFWSKPGGESELPKPNDADGAEQGSVQDQPTRKIIKTKQGHTIQFEDADGEEMVMIYVAGNDHVITMDTNGIKITDGVNSQAMILDANGIMIADKSGNQIRMDATSGFAAGPGVSINKGTDRVCLESLITWLLNHQHVGNMGAPTPLFPGNMIDLNMALSGVNNFLSKKIKVE
ncbi:MAG: phage baseplate assembly protein V [Candidatus Hodarchaeota archaeon]